MSPALASTTKDFRPRLIERRARLQAAAGSVSTDYLNDLLGEIDSALERIEQGSFGICETCHDPIEVDRLAQNPLTRFCVDHLSQKELASHQQDLDLATQIQAQLLPPKDIALEGWETQYRYQPFGAVGGDYCELIASNDGQTLFFAVGDVTGKGVAASLLMTHLSAIFRSLVSLDLPLAEVVSRANRLFCDSTGPAHYATLVCGRATVDGLEICNAGHCPPLLLRHNGTEKLGSTGLPLGIICGGQYTVHECDLDAGETLALYSDGITEAQNAMGEDYEENRLIRSLRNRFDHGAGQMADSVFQDIAGFRKPGPPSDDMTLLILRRRG